jgi:hypothetical protein
MLDGFGYGAAFRWALPLAGGCWSLVLRLCTSSRPVAQAGLGAAAAPPAAALL